MNRLIVVGIIGLLLAGCKVEVKTGGEVKETSSSAATTSEKDKKTESMKYVQDQFGLCYAVLESATSYAFVVKSITNIPCEKVPNEYYQK